ncbi:MAG TPA: hypothetical protein VGA56_16820 [Opitutaceae bacterium]
MNFTVIALLLLLAMAIAFLAAFACWRTWRNGGLHSFDEQAHSIFDEYESEGTPTDFFPGKGPPPTEYLL